MSNYVNLLDIVYPVVSVFISNNSVSPADSIGGTWTKLDSDTFICCGTPNATGGTNSIRLTIDQMPSYNHQLAGFGEWLSGTHYRNYIKIALDGDRNWNPPMDSMSSVAAISRLTIALNTEHLTSIYAQLNLFEGNFMFPSFFYGQIPKIKYKLFSYYIDYVEKKGYCREWMLCRNWYRNTLSGLSLC